MLWECRFYKLPVEWFLAALAALILLPGAAQALPAYAEQTGQQCSACHIGGFGPQLTPFGRKFKLGAYTFRGTDHFTAPVSVMALASYVHTNANQPGAPAPHYALNDNTTLDQASVFIAGGIGQHFGGFFQSTYDGVGRAYSWDNLDLRGMTHTSLADGDLVVGVSVNNSPGVQDLWNTMPAWGYPFSDTDLRPGPAAGTVLDDGLAQTVLGATAYADWNGGFYGEAGAYWTPDKGFLRAMGASAADSAGIISGAAPYFRLAYEKDLGVQNFEVGTFGFFPNLYPAGDKSTGTTDDFSDYGLDGSYEFTGNGKNVYAVNARYTHEDQHLAASRALGAASRLNDSLDDVRFDASYFWHNTFGGTVSAFNTSGSHDALLYGDNRTMTPDSTGMVFELDATPWGNHPSPLGKRMNVRVGMQYFVFTKFDGASTNYDGLGHNASDNDTFRVYLWFMG
jgi:hypothetical protein